MPASGSDAGISRRHECCRSAHRCRPRAAREDVRALGDRRLGLAGHAAFETFSVLTRLPTPARRAPATVARLLAGSFPHTRFLGAEAQRHSARQARDLGHREAELSTTRSSGPALPSTGSCSRRETGARSRSTARSTCASNHRVSLGIGLPSGHDVAVDGSQRMKPFVPRGQKRRRVTDPDSVWSEVVVCLEDSAGERLFDRDDRAVDQGTQLVLAGAVVERRVVRAVGQVEVDVARHRVDRGIAEPVGELLEPGDSEHHQRSGALAARSLPSTALTSSSRVPMAVGIVLLWRDLRFAGHGSGGSSTSVCGASRRRWLSTTAAAMSLSFRPLSWECARSLSNARRRRRSSDAPSGSLLPARSARAGRRRPGATGTR